MQDDALELTTFCKSTRMPASLPLVSAAIACDLLVGTIDSFVALLQSVCLLVYAGVKENRGIRAHLRANKVTGWE